MKYLPFLYNGKKYMLNITHGMSAFTHACKIQKEMYAWHQEQRRLRWL